MAAAIRAPKQWSLTREETITTFESWRQNLKYVLSLDANFAVFLQDDTEWEKKTRAAPLRGLQNDGELVPVAQRRTAEQKVIHLELMLGQIANFCPVISRNTIVRNSTSLDNVWQSIRAHFGFQTTGAHFIDFADFKLKPGEKPEDLYQRIVAFVEDNLLTTESGITHHDADPDEDEEVTPMVENFIVLTWLRLVHPELPALVKQRYGTELRNQTLASIKPEISQALSSLLETLNSTEDARIMRSAPYNNYQIPTTKTKTFHQFDEKRRQFPGPSNSATNRQGQAKQCPLCRAAGRPDAHYLSQCNFLPAADKKFLTKARLISILDEDDIEFDQPDQNDCSDNVVYDYAVDPRTRQTTVSRRVQVCPSPTVPMTYNRQTIPVMLDSGGETNMIREGAVLAIGAKIKPTTQSALQADGKSRMLVKGETGFTLFFEGKSFQFEGLVVEDLDVEILAGMPFLCKNDIILHPYRSLVIFNDGSSYKFPGPSSRQDPPPHSVRKVSSHVIRAPSTNTTLYPGDSIEVDVPPDLQHEPDLALEPRLNNSLVPPTWPNPEIVTLVCGKVRITNDTDTTMILKKNDQFGQLHSIAEVPQEPVANTQAPRTSTVRQQSVTDNPLPCTTPSIRDIQVDPDNLLPPDIVAGFHAVNNEFKDVFSSEGKLYNGY